MFGSIGKLFNNAREFIGKAKQTASSIGKKVFNFVSKIPTIGNRINTMNPDDVKYSYMCNEVYKKPSERQNIDGYSHSNDTDLHCIYSNGRERVLAIRGTVSVDDIITDLSIVNGTENETQRFADELNFARNNNITKVCGHSLGGSISAYVSQQLNIPAIIFNAGAGLSQIQSLLKPNSNSSLITHYRINSDPVSVLWTVGNIKVLPILRPDINPHSIEQFL